MRWASALSELGDGAAALAECASALRRQLDGDAPDLIAAFWSPHHDGGTGALAAGIAAAFPRALAFGCGAAGVIGAGREVEARPALSLTAAALPGVTALPLRFDRPLDAPETWRAHATVAAGANFLLFADPFTCDPTHFTERLDVAWPGARKMGGLASSGRFPGSNALLLDGQVHHDGAVGVALGGDLEVDTLVAQGCRPIGQPMVITNSEEHVILELDRRRPTDVLRELVESLSPEDRARVSRSLHVGLEVDGSRVEYREDELLVRNLLGLDPSSGAIAIGATPRPWQVLRFMLRDARAAADDLRAQLARHDRPARGALLFSCVARGQHLFGRADHDTDLFRERFGDGVPLGGFFAGGELGPVGATTYVHGYTSAFALFRERAP